MTPLWMLYALSVTALLFASARGAERALRLHARPARWVWGAALAGSLALPLVSLLNPPPAPNAAARTAQTAEAALPAAPLVHAPYAAFSALSGLGAALPPLLRRPIPSLWAAWAALSLAVLAFFALGQWQVSRRRRRWPGARAAGQAVRVSRAFGPAVVGVLRPEIVLPRWLLAMDRAALDLALRHEREHVRGRDTLLLAAAFLGTAAMPWNPLLWAQLRRLRMAVELDCDLRVLRGGASRRRYGALLLEVGARTGRVRLAAAALSEPPSFLERRMNMIVSRETRLSPLRTAGALALAAAGLAVACDLPAPTAPGAPPPAAAAVEGTQAQAEEGRNIIIRGINNISSKTPPIIFVDGVRIMNNRLPSGAANSPSPLDQLNPNDIERIEIISGPAASTLYGPEASAGVIQVFTKSGARGATPPGSLPSS